MRRYSRFIPPSGLADQLPREWSRRQADQYFEWLMHEKTLRISFLRGFFGEADEDRGQEELLRRLGSKVGRALSLPEFSQCGELTNAG